MLSEKIELRHTGLKLVLWVPEFAGCLTALDMSRYKF